MFQVKIDGRQLQTLHQEDAAVCVLLSAASWLSLAAVSGNHADNVLFKHASKAEAASDVEAAPEIETANENRNGKSSTSAKRLNCGCKCERSEVGVGVGVVVAAVVVPSSFSSSLPSSALSSLSVERRKLVGCRLFK